MNGFLPPLKPKRDTAHYFNIVSIAIFITFSIYIGICRRPTIRYINLVPISNSLNSASCWYIYNNRLKFEK